MESLTNYSFNSSMNPSNDVECSQSVPAYFLFTVLLMVHTLLAPVFIVVLYIGCTKWRKPYSGNIVHSDVFTLNLTIVESVNILGLYFLYVATFKGVHRVLLAANIMYFVASFIQAFCHCIVCVERYLAVVHPVIYIRLKNKKGVAIRNISILFIWGFSIIGTYINMAVLYSFVSQLVLGLLVNLFAFSVITFCSVSVLSVLIRPAPGQEVVTKSIDQSKRAAFDTIMTIMAIMVLRFSVALVLYVDQLSHLVVVDSCVLFVLTFFFRLPSSLVLPMLFLKRIRKLPGRK